MEDLKTVETIKLEPYWPATIRYFGRGLATHSFLSGSYSVISSFMEQVRFLYQTDPEELNKIIAEFAELGDR